MGESQIPVIDLSEEALAGMEEGSEGWKAVCKKVREACEEYGCFQVAYNHKVLPKHIYEEMFMAMKSLFDLPRETKKKNLSDKIFVRYVGKSEHLPLFEGLGIENAPQFHAAKAFTDLMWPQGNPNVCRAFNSMAAKLLELNLLIIKMILESFGLGKYYASYVESVETIMRVMKYDRPPRSHDSAIGLLSHTDKTISSILGQDDVQGLQVLSRGGIWIPVQPSAGTFVVLIGEMLKVLTNGRLQATKHKVDMNGDRERYSYGLFLVYKDGVEVKVPNELVDENHPPLFRPFNYSDFLHFLDSDYNDDALMAYAGI